MGADPVKSIALALSLIGIAAWAAGTAYDQGYWSVVGWESPVNRRSLQDVAFVGFVGPIVNWFYACLYFICLGIYIFILEFVSAAPVKVGKKPPRYFLELQNWIRKRKKFSPEVKKLCAVMFAGGIGFGGLIVLPFVMWVSAAYSDGRSHIKKDICYARSAKTFPTTIRLDGGGSLVGKILARSERISILIDKTFIYVIVIGEKSQVIDSTEIQSVECKQS